jgi:hypothetical protein
MASIIELKDFTLPHSSLMRVSLNDIDFRSSPIVNVNSHFAAKEFGCAVISQYCSIFCACAPPKVIMNKKRKAIVFMRLNF